MNFYQENKAFYRRMLRAPLSANAQLLWYKLMQIENDLYWPESFTADNDRLARMICAKSKNTLISARKELVDDGLISFIPGVKGKPSTYKLRSVAALEGMQIPEEPEEAPPDDFLYEVREDITTYFGYTEALGRELQQTADALWDEFCPGQTPTPGDLRNIFFYIKAQTKDAAGEWTMTFEEEGKKMLAYAFDQARQAGSVNWRYIDGIYANWAKRNIRSMQDISDYEYERERRKGRA